MFKKKASFKALRSGNILNTHHDVMRRTKNFLQAREVQKHLQNRTFSTFFASKITFLSEYQNEKITHCLRLRSQDLID